MTPEELKRAREIAEKCLVKRDNEAKRSLQEWAEHPPIFIMDIEAITLAEAVLHLSEAVREATEVINWCNEEARGDGDFETWEEGRGFMIRRTYDWISKYGEKK